MPSVVKLTLESNQYERNIKNAQKSLDEFTRAVGLNTKSLSAMALAAGAVTTALKVSKDAFNQSRDLVDEWGRTVQSAQSLYEGFLNAINNGDFSGFINNMGRITQAAREAYDAISDLELYNAFNGPNMADARTGLTEAIADFRSGSGSKEDVKAAGDVLKKELEERRKREYQAYEKVVGEEARKIGMDAKKLIGALKGKYVDFENLQHEYLPGSYTGTNVVPMFGSGTVAGVMTGGFSGTRIAKTPGTDEERLSDFARRVTPETLQKLQQYAVMSKETANEIASTDKMISRILNSRQKAAGGGGGTVKTTGDKDDFQEMEEMVGLLNIQKQKIEDLQALRPFAESEEDLARLNKEIETANTEYQRLINLGKTEPIDLENLFPDRGVAGSAFSSYGESLAQSIRQNLANGLQDADMNTLKTLLETQIRYGLESVEIPSNTIIDAIIGEGLKIPDEYWEKLQSQINEKLKELGVDELNIDFGTGENRGKDKKERSALDGSKQVVSGLTSVASGLQQMGITLPEEVSQVLSVVQGLMTVIEGVNTVIGITQTAALTANTTAMIALTAALWANTGASIIPFANGGIVPHAANGYFIPGSRFSGDTTPIMANAGELVLNKAQQGNLASQLNGGGLDNLHLETYLDGRAIRIVLNNDSQSRMKGKYVTSRNYRG